MEQFAAIAREGLILFVLFCFAFYTMQLFCYFIQFPTSPSLVLLHSSSAIPLCLPLTRSLKINYFLYTHPCQPWPSPLCLRLFQAQPSFSSLRNPIWVQTSPSPTSLGHFFLPSPKAIYQPASLRTGPSLAMTLSTCCHTTQNSPLPITPCTDLRNHFIYAAGHKLKEAAENSLSRIYQVRLISQKLIQGQTSEMPLARGYS